MLKAWLFGVGILFVLAEFSIWLKQFILPLPLYILAGSFLAISSNYERGIIALFRQSENLEADALTQTATLIDRAKAIKAEEIASLPEAE